MSELDASIKNLQRQLASTLVVLKRRKLAIIVVNSLLFAACFFIPLAEWLERPAMSFTVALFVAIVGFWWQWRRGEYFQITLEHLLEHYNRQFEHYQESAQLLLADEKQLSPVAHLQRLRVVRQLIEDADRDRLRKYLPKLNLRLTGQLLVLILVIGVLSILIDPWLRTSSLPEKLSVAANGVDTATSAVTLRQHLVKIDPPSYTGLPPSESTALDLKIPQGSQVEWQMAFNDTANHYYLVMADEKPKPLLFDSTITSEGRWRLTQQINNTQLYRLEYEKNAQRVQMDSIYSIAVIRDQPPKIQLLQPTTSLIEIQPGQVAQVTVEALVKDDYGIAEVTILASVAKGSGEAVKFRDETFTFDKVRKSPQGAVYQKQWPLTALGMEPGDEVYFSVLATDNKIPQAQQSKSASVIVRWLDDEEEEIAAEGIQIRFKPEYFRSQRQIIIETEQLIADQKDLDKVAFDEKSTDLGHSQRDLKEKYGQYLGDEFGEGPDEQSDFDSDIHNTEKHDAEKIDRQADRHASGEPAHLEKAPEVGHLHEEMVNSLDKSGSSELIAQFAHNHGSAEIGPMSSRDPKSWMKKSVSIMWQAELYLMLSEPSKALPYEYEAYRYLKLAREAEKIYVKRLGFEPPPVSESNRLKGELDKIENQHWVIESTATKETDQLLFARVFGLLSDWPADQSLGTAQQGMLQQLRARLLLLAESRPALIDYAANVEKILIQRSLKLKQCEDCVNKLRQKLWQLLEPAESSPTAARQWPIKNPAALKQYLQQLAKLAEADPLISTTRESSSRLDVRANEKVSEKTQP